LCPIFVQGNSARHFAARELSQDLSEQLLLTVFAVGQTLDLRRGVTECCRGFMAFPADHFKYSPDAYAAAR
jgi:hypothetical protein